MIETVVAYDPRWPDAFEREAAELVAAWPGRGVMIHHIGSTSVPGMVAKPIIDMLAVVTSLADAERASIALMGCGYEAKGAYGIEGRRYFRKSDSRGIRTHHLHAYEQGSPHIARHLAFRDYLRASSERAASYSALKLAIVAGKDAPDLSYVEAKAPLVARIDAESAQWCLQQTGVER